MPNDPAAARAELFEDGRLALVCDTLRVAEPGAWLFDPSYYRQHFRVRDQVAGRGSVLFIDGEQCHWVLRGYRRGGLPGKFAEERYVWPGLWRTRPFQEFRLLEKLHAGGLPVPAPVAAGVWRGRGTYRGALLMEQIRAVRALREVLAEAPQLPAFWNAVGVLIARLHRLRVHHPDLNVTNLLVDDHGGLHIIDFDRAREAAPSWLLHLGLARLRRSLRRARDGVTVFHYDDVGDWQALIDGYQHAGA
ncbi:3-deoxy-D-manno-octulosonic acid kinase [Algiphilus sp.]|uniref:3-deoxy-D-manno-octulosonic acid kinase n=1 Tax=Algiphilus sp. TaxID=1872431 RepID=UPI003BAABA18